jgi:hypothetical protein
MEDDIENLPDAVLLALPDAQVSPGALTLLWARKANAAQERDLTELYAELNGVSRSHRMIGPTQTHDEAEKRRREVKAREDDLLRRIAIEQDRIRVEIEELDERTIRLHDGRRAYVDGTEYRDGEGRALRGTDRDEAQAQHRLAPNAATWTERQDLERQTETAKNIKERVQQHAGDPEALAEDEKEFSQKIQARTARLEKTPDPYASSDYTAAYQGTDRTTSHAATLADAPDTAKLKQEFSTAATGEGAKTADNKDTPETVPGPAPRQTFTR